MLSASSEREALDLGAQPHVESHPDQMVSNAHTSRRSNLLIRMWNRHVVLTVSSSKCRDHFGTLSHLHVWLIKWTSILIVNVP